MNFDIRALADLLNPEQEESGDEDVVQTPYAKMTPGDIGSEPSQGKNGSASAHTQVHEVNNTEEESDIQDTREQPEYDIIYKQAVSSEDMFLGMGHKTPATASCENIVVKIKLPEAKLSEVQLDVKKNYLDCQTPKYKLGLHLPHPVDEKTAKAQWDGSIFTLAVTLNLVRDYDFMNF